LPKFSFSPTKYYLCTLSDVAGLSSARILIRKIFTVWDT